MATISDTVWNDSHTYYYSISYTYTTTETDSIYTINVTQRTRATNDPTANDSIQSMLIGMILDSMSLYVDNQEIATAGHGSMGTQTLNISYNITKTNVSQTKALAIKNKVTNELATSIFLTISPRQHYPVIYNSNGGTGTISDDDKILNQPLTLDNGSGFSRTHYVLTHWNTEANGNGINYILGDSYTDNSVITLYAQWTSIQPQINIIGIDRIAGEYKLTTDSSIVTNKIYYEQSGNGRIGETGDAPHTYTSITPLSNPSENNYYEATVNKSTKEDEGRSAVITANFTWQTSYNTQNISNPTVSIYLSAPTIVVTTTSNDVISTYQPYVVWYTNETLTDVVNWSNLNSSSQPKTLYGYIDDMFDSQTSFPISITPNTITQYSYNNNTITDSGTTITYILASAFYTIDFLAGGHGIAFGMPSSSNGFYCAMDVFLPLDDIGNPTSTEAKLYQAAQAGADILVPSTTTIDLKKLLYHSLVWN